MDLNSYGPDSDFDLNPAMANLRSAQVRAGGLCHDEPEEDETHDGEDELAPRGLQDCDGQRCHGQVHGCTVLNQGVTYKYLQGI